MGDPVSLLVLACAASLVCSIGAVLWCAIFASPALYIKRCNRLESGLVDSIASNERLEAKWVAYKAELSGIHEAIEGVLDSVERKRRRISGAESRLNQTAETVPQTRDEIVSFYRAKQAASQR